MLTEERHDRIKERLARDGKVLASNLAAEFGVTEDTVRRDLRELAKTGHCRRVYGGALSLTPDLGNLAARTTVSADSKSRLAHATAGLLKDGQTVFIDAGSTNLAIAQALPRDRELTVITNAPVVALAFSDHPGCTVIVLGGSFDQTKGACIGAQTVRDIQAIYADVFILGTCGVDTSVGVTALDAAEADVKRAMLEQSSTLIVAASPDKIGTVAPFKIASVSSIDHLIVDQDTSAQTVAAFAAEGVQVHLAG